MGFKTCDIAIVDKANTGRPGAESQCVVHSIYTTQMRPGSRSPGRAGTLELAFETKLLRAICESEAHAKHDLGAQVAEVLKHRLADLRAASSPKDLVAGNPRELGGSGSQRQMVVDVCDGHRIVLCANHPKNPMTTGGDLDWSRVSRVKILRIDKDDA